MRKILHIDMDAFYASVEQRDHPAYRGRPVVVGGRPEQRGAVAAASYEARQYGIHSAMPSRIAQQRCRDLIFVKPRFDVYRQVSEQIRAVFDRYTDLAEPLSLDEAYLDVTENKLGMTSAVAIARQIKQDIQQDTRLTASAGVSVNKFLAKVASGLNKPDGLTLIAPDQIPAFIESLPIEKFHGIGRVTAAKMRRLGISTGADLKQWSEADLVRRFGKVGRFYYGVARGEDPRLVNPNRIRKSIGAEKSFAPDLDSLGAMENALGAIAAKVSERIRLQQRRGYTLTLKIKYADYHQITRSRTLADLISPGTDLQCLALDLIRSHLDPGRPVRLLGLAISNLEPVDAEYIQLCLNL
ncbi:DNA polymerase IV [filamentous cyanobacterium CCP5]|nr:DNA polymerase IV [filamentous cyanobacterium CCP5]